MLKIRQSRCLATTAWAALASVLAGCATLPASGPTAAQINRGAKPANNTLGFRIVDIDPPVVADVEQSTGRADGGAATLASLNRVGRTDTVGKGDILAINIYEVGVGLFGSGRAGSEQFDPSARGEVFPAITVDPQGFITLPYVGRIQTTGRTTEEIQGQIVRSLRGLSQNPQVVVTIRENLSNTVFVSGDVRRPGRQVLTAQRERLLDLIAAAGGAANTAEDTIVRFNRGDRTVEERLGRIRPGAADDLVLLAGDRIELIKRPRSYIVLGATSRVQQVPFEFGDVSLAEAIARAGGPADSAADPAAIYLFRYAPAVDGKAEAPTVYHLNLMNPNSYFLSQRFAVRDKDVLYIANAAANQPAKLVSILNQLFSPFITLRAVTR